MASVYSRDALNEFLIDGLKNAHAMESQAVTLTTMQADRLKNYPELEARIRQHIEETKGQRDRLEAALGEFNVSPSALKDFALKASGNMAAVLHSFMEDEVIKNSFASFAYENFEIAAYTSLIAAGEQFDKPGVVAVCKQNLAEEVAMADWLLKNIPKTTLQFVSRTAEGQTAQAKR